MALINTTHPRWMMELGPDRIGKYTDDEVTEVICRMPVALSFIEDQKDEWIRFAVQYSIMGISYVKNPSVEIQRLAYKSNSGSLSWMNDIDEELAIEILMEKPHLLHVMPNPTPMMISVAKLYT